MFHVQKHSIPDDSGQPISDRSCSGSPETRWDSTTVDKYYAMVTKRLKSDRRALPESLEINGKLKKGNLAIDENGAI
jgi:hypothetical protein